MQEIIADIRARLGTCQQRDADAAVLLGILDSCLEQLRIARENVDQAERILESLTPGGSQFHGSPENCADWVRDRQKSYHDSLCRAVKDRNQAQANEARMREGYVWEMQYLEMQYLEMQ